MFQREERRNRDREIKPELMGSHELLLLMMTVQVISSFLPGCRLPRQTPVCHYILIETRSKYVCYFSSEDTLFHVYFEEATVQCSE